MSEDPAARVLLDECGALWEEAGLSKNERSLHERSPSGRQVHMEAEASRAEQLAFCSDLHASEGMASVERPSARCSAGFAGSCSTCRTGAIGSLELR